MKESIHLIIYFYVLISIASLANANFNVVDCPGPPDPSPCHCASEEGTCDPVVCNCVTESERLRNSLKLLRNIPRLEIKDSRIKPLKSDALRGPKITLIFIGDSQISMESPQFLGQESSLERFYVHRCFDEQNPMNPWDLGHLQRLSRMLIFFNKIPTLKNDWITTSAPSLKYLALYGNEIRQLEDGVFQKLTELESLYLYMNQITVISRSMFPRPAKLRTLALYQNEIEHLPDDIFEDMPNLESVSVAENRLKTLRETIWAPLFRRSVTLHIRDNPFRCDESLEWITRIRMPTKYRDIGQCLEPDRLKGRLLTSLRPNDFA